MHRKLTQFAYGLKVNNMLTLDTKQINSSKVKKKKTNWLLGEHKITF